MRAAQKALLVSFLTASIWFWAASPAFCLTSLMRLFKGGIVGLLLEFELLVD